MPIYVTKNCGRSGPYEDHIAIHSAIPSTNDIGIRHGGSSWQRLGGIFPEMVRNEPMPFPVALTAAVAFAGQL